MSYVILTRRTIGKSRAALINWRQSI